MAISKEARTAAECVAVDRSRHTVWNKDVALDFFTHLVQFEDVLEANLEVYCSDDDPSFMH